jgi:23S rRNA (adenine2503-C2)-methyltransferase
MEILDLTKNELEDLLSVHGFKKYRAGQIMRWIYSRYIYSFEEMTDLSKNDRDELSLLFSINPLKCSEIIKSKDGTEKMVFELEDRSVIESVIIPDERRITICVSTQVGCPLKCSFCKTGTLGFKRDLSVREITGQVLAASQYLSSLGKRITNVVYMGMGEPLLNFDATVKSIKLLVCDHGLNMSNRKITVSTVGIADKIVSLGELTGVNLAISLHAVTDEKRSKIMGVNSKYPISEILDEAKKYPAHPRKKVVLEYIMLKGFNDTLFDADKLLKIARRVNAKVNLIPFNSFPGSLFEPSEKEDILKFQTLLLDGKITTKIRKSKGCDELAACGQLGRVS